MDRKTFWAGGALVGAGLMALFDPNRGRRRRALLRDKATGAADVVGTAAGKTWRDLRNRAEGVAARGRGLFDHEVAGSDALAGARAQPDRAAHVASARHLGRGSRRARSCCPVRSSRARRRA
jgi:hypothetical protein